MTTGPETWYNLVVGKLNENKHSLRRKGFYDEFNTLGRERIMPERDHTNYWFRRARELQQSLQTPRQQRRLRRQNMPVQARFVPTHSPHYDSRGYVTRGHNGTIFECNVSSCMSVNGDHTLVATDCQAECCIRFMSGEARPSSENYRNAVNAHPLFHQWDVDHIGISIPIPPQQNGRVNASVESNDYDPDYDEDDYDSDEGESHDGSEIRRVDSYIASTVARNLEEDSDEEIFNMAKMSLTTVLARRGYIHLMPRKLAEAIPDMGYNFLRRHNVRASQLIPRRYNTIMPEPREMVIERHRRLIQGLGFYRDQESNIILPDYNASLPSNYVSCIDRVGCELEGGWSHNPDFTIHGDGSVDGGLGDYVGESHTYPVAIKPMLSSSVENTAFDEGFLNRYPEDVNSSCGLHVHMSMKSIGAYNAFASEEFYTWLINGIRAWGEGRITSTAFRSRLEGGQHYAPIMYAADTVFRQINARNKYDSPRYNAINYCFRTHGTLEVRVLPMLKDQHLALKMVHRLVHLFFLWDSVNGPQPRKFISISNADADEDSIKPAFDTLLRGNYPQPQVIYANCRCGSCRMYARENNQASGWSVAPIEGTCPSQTNRRQ